MYALGGVYSGTAHGVAKLVASSVMITYCSMALYSGLKIMNGLKDLAARNTVAAKAKRTIFHYIVAAFVCVLLTCVYVEASSNGHCNYIQCSEICTLRNEKFHTET